MARQWVLHNPLAPQFRTHLFVFDTFSLGGLVRCGRLSGECRGPLEFTRHFIDNDANDSNGRRLTAFFKEMEYP